MKQSFEVVKLSDVCNSETSNLTLKNLENNFGEYSLYGASGFIKNIDFYKQDKDYIGIVKDGAGIGRVMLLEKYSSILGTMQYIIPKENINIKYLYYNLIKMNLSKYFTGSTIPHIYFKDYKKEKVFLRTLPEQEKISIILDKVSKILEMKKQQFLGLDSLVKFQFLKMFGLPNSNRYNFKLGTIRDCVAKIQYGTSKPSTSDGKYKYLRMNNITYDGYLDISDIKTIDVSDSEFEKFSVKYGDVLFNRTNSPELVGKTCVFNLDTPMIIAGYIIRIKVNDKILPVYLSTMLNTSYGKKLLYSISKKSIGQANINAQELQNIKILIPPIELQNKFADFVKQVDKSKVILGKALKFLSFRLNYFNML